MPKQNPFQSIVSELAGELKQARLRANNSKVVPFGTEQVSARDTRTRAQTMTRADLETMEPNQYQQFLQTVGEPAVMDIITRQEQRPTFSEGLNV